MAKAINNIDFQYSNKQKQLLTPNSRIARLQQDELLEQYTANSVLSLQAWLQELYLSSLFVTTKPCQLISPQQESLIWQSIISESPHGDALLNVDSTVKLVMQAYGNIVAAQLTLDAIKDDHAVDVRALHDWARKFEQSCHEQNLINQASLMSYLTEHITAIKSSLPHHLVFYNFDEITPNIKHFISTLETSGIKVEYAEVKINNVSVNKFVCADIDDEISTMLRFAQTEYERNPETKITCIAPNLTEIREQILSKVERIFFPNKLLNPEFSQNIINISGGYSLANAPIIHFALDLLSLNPVRIDINKFSQLLKSPFATGYEDEIHARMLFDANIRETGQPHVSWAFIIKTLNNNDNQAEYAQSLEKLAHALNAFYDYRRGLQKKQRLSEWKNDFQQLLSLIGWPGDTNLSSEQYQQVQKFYDLLHDFGNLALNEERYSYTQATSLFRKMITDTLFEIESHDGPIQILGMLEAAGNISEQCWVMNLNDTVWPQAPSPNPFLPISLQQEYQMPHCSAEREYDFSTNMTKRLINSCSKIIFSYHQHDDEKELSESPLLNGIEAINLEQLNLAPYNSIEETIFANKKVENIIDIQGPSIKQNEISRGGTGIFTDQSACPFRAFANYRLHATGIASATIGFDALTRGSMLHKALEMIWKELKSHQTLTNISTNDLQTLINKAIAAAIREYRYKHDSSLGKKYIELEESRLETLLKSWLKLEKSRPSFTVLAQEHWKEFKVNDLLTKLQVDRIDLLESGEKIIIDYKTGKTNSKHWFGERPKQPQLPIYCLTDNTVDAISFAQVRIDELKFNGISDHEIDIAGIKPAEKSTDFQHRSWDELIEQWRITTASLADEFTQGLASVTPTYRDTCDYCELQQLCRIYEKADV